MVASGLHLLARLREETPDLTIAPPGDDTLAVVHEPDTVALAVGVVDPEQLGSILGVPDSDVVARAGREDIGVHTGNIRFVHPCNLLWEGDVVDLVGMAGVPDLSIQLVAVHPVDVALGRSAEEVREVPREGEGGDRPPDLGSLLDLHGLDRDLSDRPEARADDEVTVRE